MKTVKRFALLAIGVFLLSSMLSAQHTPARIYGIVQREDGSAVPGVHVEAFSPKLVGKANTFSDKNGVFRLANLSPGTYKMVFTREGFLTIIRTNIKLVAEQTLNLKVQLKQGNSEETISTGQTTLIDVKATTDGMTLTKEMFDVLPKGRNFDGLIAVIPGAGNEPLLGGLSIGGASGGENMFYVDGQNTNSVFGGQGKQSVVFDFIDEVLIKTSGFQAEFAGSLGGVINVVTRSGGNEFHGDIVGYYSGSALRGKERDTTIIDPLISEPTLRIFNYADRGQELSDSRFDGGFGLGGYIIKDKLWFYVNALPVFRSTTQQAIYLYPSDPSHAVSDPFAATPVINKYLFKQTSNDLNFMVKLSAQPIKNMRLSLGFVNNYNVWQGGLPSRDGSSYDSYDFSKLGYGKPSWSTSANVDYTINNNFLVNARAGYFFLGTTNKLDPSQANTNFEPQYVFTIGNTAIIDVPAALRRPTGWQSRSSQSMTYPFEKDEESNFSAGVDLTYFLNLAGEHAWKAGIAFTRASVNKDTLFNAPQVTFTAWRAASGSTPFRASVRINGGAHSRVNPDFPSTGQYGEFGNVHSDRLALYLQDSWTIANKFTLNFGVRLESENVPSFNDDPEYADYLGQDVIKFKLFDKFAPRLGFVYDVLGDSSLKIYGSYGLYYDVMDLDMSMYWFGGRRWISDYYYLYDANKIFDIGKLKADGTRDYSMLYYLYYVDQRPQNWTWRLWESTGGIDPDLKPMSQNEMTFGIEKKISDDLSLSVHGIWRNLVRIIEDVYRELPQYWTGSDLFMITNPGEGWSLPDSQGGEFFDVFWPCPKAQRDYKALELSLQKKMSSNWLAGCNLTLSRLYGNYTGTVSADEAVANNGSGRLDGNMTRYFDAWWLPYTSAGSDANGNGTLNNGLLPTDRTLVAKAYGSYSFPFGLTLGGVFNYMSGTPKSTEFYVDQVPGYYPLGRNDLGRTPSLWFLNLYAEYSIKLGRNNIQFSINVDNVFNNDTATWYYTCINNRSVYTYWDQLASRGSQLAPGGDTVALIKQGYDLFAMEGTWPQAYNKWTRDPRYNKPILYQAPISARLGVKFIF
jgi:hypothetical protein